MATTNHTACAAPPGQYCNGSAIVAVPASELAAARHSVERRYLQDHAVGGCCCHVCVNECAAFTL